MLRWMLIVLGMFIFATPALAWPKQVIGVIRSGDFQYQLSLEPCSASTGCPIRLSLLHNGKLLDKLVLPIAAAQANFSSQSADASWLATGVGAQPGVQIWGAGEEENYVGVAALPVDLGDKQSGLLLTQLCGFQNLYRVHMLFTINQRQLVLSWSYQQPQFLAWTSIEPVSAQARPALFFLENTGAHYNAPERTQAVLLIWDSGHIKQIPLPSVDYPLYLLHGVSYATVDEAAQIRELLECEAAFKLMLLDMADYPQWAGNPGDILLGKIFFSIERAQQLQHAIEKCEPGMALKITELSAPE